jgi:hypothetical protein
MKKIILLCAIIVGITGGTAYASFPVKKDVHNNKTTVSEETNVEEKVETAETFEVSQEDLKKVSNKKEKGSAPDEWTITLLLCILLGGVAAHRWYAKKPIGWNILFILTGGGCGIWWLIDLVKILKREF